jgi:hypothetical protein
VARTNPLGKIKDVALGTLLHPVGTAGKAVEQAKGTAAIGRMVAGQVARTAASAAVETVGGVARRAGGSAPAEPKPTAPATGRATRGDEPNLRPVPTVNEPAHTSAPAARRGRKAASPESTKNHGDQLAPVTKAVNKAPAKKTPAKKAAESPVVEQAAVTPTAKKATAKKTAAKKAPAKKAPAKKTAVSDTDLTTKKTPAKKLAAEGLGDVTPADVAKVAKKTPTKQTTPVTPVTEPTAKTTAKKATAKKTAKKTADQAPSAAQDAPRTASEVANEEGPEYTTPVGTTAAGESALPNTDLQQPGTEPLMDPSTVNAVKSESETMQRAADPDKG